MPEADRSMKRIKPPHIILGVVLVALAVFVVPQFLSEQPGTRKVEGSVITETIDVVDTNASATYTIRSVEGSDLEHESTHMFESLAGLPGVGKASLDTQAYELTVTYHDAVIAESSIRDRLTASGYVAPTLDDATPTVLSEDGSSQRVSVDDLGDGFVPDVIHATAGIPIEMEFSPGTECRIVVKFPELGIEQDISEGGTVALPALEPGEYQIACSGDAQEGLLIVE